VSLHSSNIKRVFGFVVALGCTLCLVADTAQAQRRRAPVGNRSAVVVDERLADGLTFYRVAVTRRTGGWLQSDAVVSPGKADDDERLLRLVRGSDDFDRVVRARIFLDLFSRSPARPEVLMIYGEAAEAAASHLSRDAARRLDEREMTANGAPVFSYFLNYNGLDRYRRQGIAFTFNRATKQFHYDGESWREIVRRYPRSPQAEQARKRLESFTVNTK
jgi:hypothetical protein